MGYCIRRVSDDGCILDKGFVINNAAISSPNSASRDDGRLYKIEYHITLFY